MGNILKLPPSAELIRNASREEIRLCSLMLKDKQCVEKIVDAGVTSDWFWDDKFGEMFGICSRYFVNHSALMPHDTYGALVRENTKDQTLAMVKAGVWTDAYNLFVKMDELPHLLEAITGRYAQRLAYDVAARHLDALATATGDLKGVAERFVTDVANVEMPGVERYEVVRENTRDLIKQCVEEAKDRQKNPLKYQGIRSGFKTIDSVFNGFHKGRSLVMCGPEGGGKSSVMLNFADNMVQLGNKVAYVTVESKSKDLEMRLLSREARVDFNRIMAGGNSEAHGLTDVSIKFIEEAAERRLKSAADNYFPMTVDYDTPWPMIARQLDRLFLVAKLDVLYIDYLDVIGRVTHNEKRPDLDLGNLFSNMVNYARKRDVFFVTAMQLKADKVREMWKQAKAGKEIFASTGDVSGTRIIGAMADYMILLMIDPITRKRMRLYSMKTRMGPSGEPFVLDYKPEEMLMSDPPEQASYDRVSDRMENDDNFKDEVLNTVKDSPVNQSVDQAEVAADEGVDDTVW